MDTEMKTCKVCGKELPPERFEQIKPQNRKPYRISICMRCRSAKVTEERNSLSADIEVVIDRSYKEIKPERVLRLEDTNIMPLGTDETFVKLMDYKDVWLSNYGRVVRLHGGAYQVLSGSRDGYGSVRYTVNRTYLLDGKWSHKRVTLYAAQAVVEEFIVNPDVEHNKHIWHGGGDKEDCYYRNLYPLNQEQYRVVKAHFRKTGDDSEEYILKVMNDIKFKPENWSRRSMKPVMCGIGYRGSEGVELESEAYQRWHDMIHRCYNEKFHERQPQYKECAVCEEWLNFSNFKCWFDKNSQKGKRLDLDKDILFKGNKVYSPETCCLVPHAINTLFLNGKKARGDLPMGVSFDKDRGKYRASVAFMGKSVKLGRFATVEAAFARYKEYKEDLIQDLAEQYKEEIPDKVYQAMMNWKVEVTD